MSRTDGGSLDRSAGGGRDGGPLPEDYEAIEQVIAADGSYDGEAVVAMDLDDDTLRSIYGTVVRSRAIEERRMTLQRGSELPIRMACRGEEAAHVGPTAHLRRLPHTVAVGTTVPQAVGHARGRKYQGRTT